MTKHFTQAMAACVVLLVVSLGACRSGDDDDEANPATTERRPESTTTQPPGTDADGVQPIVEALIVRLDRVTDQIVQDPSVVNDPNSELIEQFTAVYAPGAEGLTGGLNAFRQSAADGTYLEPLNADTTGRTAVTGAVEVIDEDTVKVPVCHVQTYRKVDRNGSVIEYIDGLSQPGEVWSIRTEGEWRLERSDLFENTVCTAQDSSV